MIEIIKVLMEYGMAFEYEHKGADGEKIRSYDGNVDVYTDINGFVHLCIHTEPQDVLTLPIEDKSFKYISMKVKEECIQLTSSF